MISFRHATRRLLAGGASALPGDLDSTSEPPATAATDTPPRLSVEGLGKRFGSEVVADAVDIEVGRDEFVSLLGPSGCGKTTVLRCVAGVETPDAGEIRIDGTPVFGPGVSKPPEERAVAMVYQNYAIWPHKSVYENVVFPLKYAGGSRSRADRRARVEEVLALVDIAHLADAPATDLSGGQQQRTALARALVHDPDLLLLDEPMSNLDEELRKTMRYELQRLQQELGFSVLYVTHDQEEAFYLADRVLVMNEGGIVERGTPRALYRRPASAFTRSFIGGRNRLRGRLEVDADGEAVVRTDVVEFPLDNVDYVSETVEPGPVDCFVRPGDIALRTIDPDGLGGLAIRGRVSAEGLLGGRYDVTVRFEGSDQELNVHTDDYRALERGQDVFLRVQPKAFQVYRAPDA